MVRQTVVLVVSKGDPKWRSRLLDYFFDNFELYLDKQTDNTLVVIADLNSGLKSGVHPSLQSSCHHQIVFEKLHLLSHPINAKIGISQDADIRRKYLKTLSGKEPWQIYVLITRSQFYIEPFKNSQKYYCTWNYIWW